MSGARLEGRSIAVLLGGDSPEREISLLSGAAVCDALAGLGVAVLRLDTASGGWWARLAAVDAAFVMLHGGAGEDGTVQGALQTLSVAYTGSGVLASALAMDKARCKCLWRCAGLPTPDFVELSEGSDFRAVLARLGAAFVKPACGGSSLGNASARDPASLAAARREAARYGGRVLAEALVDGEEYTVAILDGEALPAIKMETANEFYDYQAKYHSEETRYLCPCGLSEAEERELARLALAAFESLGCESWGRVDFMRDRRGRFWILEVNTVPGMSGHSLVPMAASAAGIDMPELVGRIAAHGLRRGGGS